MDQKTVVGVGSMGSSALVAFWSTWMASVNREYSAFPKDDTLLNYRYVQVRVGLWERELTPAELRRLQGRANINYSYCLIGNKLYYLYWYLVKTLPWREIVEKYGVDLSYVSADNGESVNSASAFIKSFYEDMSAEAPEGRPRIIDIRRLPGYEEMNFNAYSNVAKKKHSQYTSAVHTAAYGMYCHEYSLSVSDVRKIINDIQNGSSAVSDKWLAPYVRSRDVSFYRSYPLMDKYRVRHYIYAMTIGKIDEKYPCPFYQARVFLENGDTTNSAKYARRNTKITVDMKDFKEISLSSWNESSISKQSSLISRFPADLVELKNFNESVYRFYRKSGGSSGVPYYEYCMVVGNIDDNGRILMYRKCPYTTKEDLFTGSSSGQVNFDEWTEISDEVLAENGWTRAGFVGVIKQNFEEL